jgi:hypothetical protein
LHVERANGSIPVWLTTYPSNVNNDLLPLDFALADRNRTSREFDRVHRVPVF